MGVSRGRCQPGHAAGHNQSTAPCCIRPPLVRTPPMYNHRRAIQAGMKKLLVGFDRQRIRHVAGCIGDHAIGGNDGEGLDAAWVRHTGAGKPPNTARDFSSGKKPEMITMDCTNWLARASVGRMLTRENNKKNNKE